MTNVTAPGSVPARRSGGRRYRNPLRPRFQRWLLTILRTGRLPAFLIAAGAGVILYGFLVSPDYAVDTIVVEGAELGDPSTVAEVSGAAGTSVFWVDPDQVARRVAGLPYVERVETNVAFPSRLTVRITERQPVLIWQSQGNRLLIDEHGNVLAGTDSESLPVVTGAGSPPAVGDQLPTERVSAIMAAREALGQRTRLTWTETDGLTAELSDGRTVVFGEPAEFQLKLAVYERVRQDVDESWSVLDLREPDRPYFK